MFHGVVDFARSSGYTKITAEYIPTPKNQLVAGLYENLGFSVVSRDPHNAVRYELLLDDLLLPKTFVRSAK